MTLSSPTMTALLAIILGALLLLYLAYLYIAHNDRGLSALPPQALAFNSHRYGNKEIEETAERLRNAPTSILDGLPPKTGRKYIVTGGVSNCLRAPAALDECSFVVL